jgi:hypothetical protein
MLLSAPLSLRKGAFFTIKISMLIGCPEGVIKKASTRFISINQLFWSNTISRVGK